MWPDSEKWLESGIERPKAVRSDWNIQNCWPFWPDPIR